ncbi:hypothetical protein Syun_025959 [Stephania yunnanensis]|uniref:Uncharacterized protein n=1 Tax=Stephania yunnanensis TaxID=152371 RepID=A0AAP0ET35_9MAGN
MKGGRERGRGSEKEVIGWTLTSDAEGREIRHRCGLRLLSRISRSCVHEALDCSTRDPALSKWRPELALGARVSDSTDLASTARDLVSGQLGATIGGNLVARSKV